MIDVDPAELTLTSNGLVPGAYGGEPVHSSAVIAEQDGLRVGIWTCEPGEFPWNWSHAEMLHIIDGEGTVTESNGRVHVLAPGKVFFMEAGSSGHWKITRTVRKSYAVPSPAPSPTA